MKKIITISAMMLLLTSCVSLRPATCERDAGAIEAAKERVIKGQGKVIVVGNGYRIVLKG